MTNVETYMRRGSSFVPLAEWNGPVQDERHIEGAIELTVDGVSLISKDMWDDVDQVWAYIVDGIQTLHDVGLFETHFPGHPTKLTLQRSADPARVTIVVDGERRVAADAQADEFIRSMRQAALQFFKKMESLPTAHRHVYRQYIARLTDADR